MKVGGYSRIQGQLHFAPGITKVDEVLDFTVPGNAMGATISEVLCMYSPSDVLTWVSSFDIQSAFPNLALLRAFGTLGCLHDSVHSPVLTVA